MKLRFAAATTGIMLVLASFGVANADALSVSCSGLAAASSITWTAATTGGVAPVALLWGNGSTSTSQTVSYAVGMHTITIEATDASSTVATSTCSATIAAPTFPAIASFIATPPTIAVGQSSVLSWSVANASSTSIDNGLGTIASTSITVSPTVTTIYQLSAVNPNGTTTAIATVTVNATSTGTTTSLTGIRGKIAELFRQIAALQSRLAALIAERFGVTVENPGFIPPGQIGKAACIILNRDLHEGSRGDDVRKLQGLLGSDSDLGYNASTTGVFGPITAKALKKFQEKHGIVSSGTGYAGSLTRGFFSRSCGKGLIDRRFEPTSTTSTTTSAPASSGNRGRGQGGNPHDDE